MRETWLYDVTRNCGRKERPAQRGVWVEKYIGSDGKQEK